MNNEIIILFTNPIDEEDKLYYETLLHEEAVRQNIPLNFTIRYEPKENKEIIMKNRMSSVALMTAAAMAGMMGNNVSEMGTVLKDAGGYTPFNYPSSKPSFNTKNQRKNRKNRRRSFAAGNRKAFV